VADFFNIGNKKFDISQLGSVDKEDIEKLGDKKLIELFNAINLNGDASIDASEISVFAEKVQANSDEIELYGAESIAEIFNISVSNNKMAELVKNFYALSTSEFREKRKMR